MFSEYPSAKSWIRHWLIGYLGHMHDRCKDVNSYIDTGHLFNKYDRKKKW